MPNEIHLNPTGYNYQKQVCEAEPTSSPLASPTNASVLPVVRPAPSAIPATVAPLWRNSPLAHQALLQKTISLAAARRTATNRDASFVLGVSLLAGCGYHPPLGENSTDGNGGPDADGGSAPQLTGSTVFANAPCGADGVITDLDEGIGVCANYLNGNHQLFSWDPSQPNSARSIVPLGYLPDQVLQDSENNIYITTYQNPGLYVINRGKGYESHFSFPISISLPTSRPSSSGRNLSSLTPSTPKGLVELAGQIFVAASNYDAVNKDFQPGLVLACPSGGGDFVPFETSGYNPTSVGTANGLLFVVSSGALDQSGRVVNNAAGDGYLDLFDPNSHARIRSIPLGRHGAGLAGEIAISPDGRTVILPTADNSGLLLVVDLLLGQREISLRSLGLSGDLVLLSSLQISQDGRYVLTGNYNDGKVYAIDLKTDRLTGPPLLIDRNIRDYLGLSDGLRSGADFFLGMGSQVLRLQTANP